MSNDERRRVFVVVVTHEDMPFVEAYDTRDEAWEAAERLGMENLSLHVCYLDDERRLADASR